LKQALEIARLLTLFETFAAEADAVASFRAMRAADCHFNQMSVVPLLYLSGYSAYQVSSVVTSCSRHQLNPQRCFCRAAVAV